MNFRRIADRYQHLPKRTRAVLLTCLYGAAAGLAAVVFQLGMNLVYQRGLVALSRQSWPIFLFGSLAVIVSASLVVGWLLSAFCPEAAGSGIPQLKAAFWKDFGFVPWRVVWVKFVAGVVSIGGGCSLGREGPSVQLAGAFASNLSGLAGEPKQNRRFSAAAGGAAGLAAAFNTPLAAISFTLEEIIGDLNSRYVGGLLLASVTVMWWVSTNSWDRAYWTKPSSSFCQTSSRTTSSTSLPVMAPPLTLRYTRPSSSVTNGSSGGARPKIVALVSADKKRVLPGTRAAKGFEPWIIKFSCALDGRHAGAVEYIYSLMARKAGIEMPETYLFPSKISPGHFGVRRFDRLSGQKIHVHSACGLLHADYRQSTLDYEGLVRLTALLTKDIRETARMVRLMIYNVKAGNRDDHSRNFSFLLDSSGEWKLSPAYDLTPSGGVNGEQTAMVNGKGRGITNSDLLAVAAKAGLPATAAREMIERTEDALSEYPSLCKQFGIKKPPPVPANLART